MSEKPPFSPRQKEFILNANKKYNLAHGSVRAGKTVASLYTFLQHATVCPGNAIYIFGNTLSTIYRNLISLLFDSPELKFLSPFCRWSKGDYRLLFGTKTIQCIGGGDEGALGLIQGLTIDLCYCDEMTLYPLNVINMIDTRLSRDHSKLFASMNPKQPDHVLKQWIDKSGIDPLYYALHFVMDDNIFLSESYKTNIRSNLKGLFFKRNFLGLWCMAEGAIYDFFDRQIHVTNLDLRATEYWIAGIDHGTSSVFACVLIAVSSGRNTQSGKKMRVVKEYYWNVEETKRQKTNADYIRDLQAFFGEYSVKAIYVDPSASAFKLEMRKAGFHTVDANNDVADGIQTVAMLMSEGTLDIKDNCRNLIREIEGYIWDEKKAQFGQDAPVKKHDHACDALRYAVYTHKVPKWTETILPAPGRYMLGGQ